MCNPARRRVSQLVGDPIRETHRIENSYFFGVLGFAGLGAFGFSGM